MPLNVQAVLVSFGSPKTLHAKNRQHVPFCWRPTNSPFESES